jgi:hypothetical protein
MLIKKIHANAFVPRALALALLAFNIQEANGVLTAGATVTADSIYPCCSGGYSNCLNGLVDGKFPPQGYSPSTHCCAHTTYSPETWLNIDMGSRAVVQTVLIINREDCCAERIIGSDLYVGDSSLPY